jgi:hypothetical protein
MFGFAAFSDAGFSSQTTADARHIGTGQAITSAISGGTILGGALIAVTGQGLSSAVGTTSQLVIMLPSGQTMSIPAVGVTPETRFIATNANLSMTATVESLGSDFLIKVIATPGSNLISTALTAPSLFTWAGVDDNVTDETSTWTDVDTEAVVETTDWRNT